MLRFSVLFLAIIYNSLVGSEDIKDLNTTELLRLSVDTQQTRFGDVKSSDVKFFLVSRDIPKQLISDDVAIDVIKPTKFIIHGWIENSRRTWYTAMTKEFLEQDDYNVVQVDWERPSRSNYVSSAYNTKLVGELISKFIRSKNISPKSTHLIGLSLGAHVAGFAGKSIARKTGEKISRISGLDPAGPYFNQFQPIPSERLSKDDADVVDVIHTDAGTFGIVYSLGTFDIVVNEGKSPQPGCLYNLEFSSIGELLQKSFCSHARSTLLFIEWINHGRFQCQICESLDIFTRRNCGRELILGEKDVDDALTGICFTETTSEKPYLIKY